MSEFKFACPVCGQHMMCDSSQGGSVMECPTCFQKITAPQAPAPDAKFILTGTKVSEKRITVRGFAAAAGGAVAPEKPFPLALFLGVALLVLAAAGTVFAFRGKIFKTAKPPPVTVAAATNAAPAPKPAPVAPPANYTNWLLTLDEVDLPAAPVVGRIHGRDFIVERAAFQVQNSVLILRPGTRGPVEFGAQINFSGALPESLAGKSLNIIADTNKSARVTLHWPDDTGAAQKASYDNKYAMRLEFGTLAKGRLPGKIYLCTPDAEKSYLMGSFTAAIIKPKPKPAAP